MANQRKLISNENLQTVVAVCFVLALLSVAFNFYNFTRGQRTEAIAVSASKIDVTSLQDGLAASKKQIEDLEQQVQELERRLEAVTAPPEAAQASAAVAP